MPVSSIVAGLQSETALQQAKDAKAAIEESFKSDRNVGNTMGKNDFLKLLSAQLQYQDPLEPVKDSDFAAQLAQFSSLEQMENMNNTLLAMANYQTFGLIGKYVVANAYVDGEYSEIPGIVDSIFTRDGVTYATVGKYAVPVGTITDVSDSSFIVSSKSFMETSNSLMGKYVKADLGENNSVEGYVKRLAVEEGTVYAYLEDASGKTLGVPVECIIDIRQDEGAGEGELAVIPKEDEKKEL